MGWEVEIGGFEGGEVLVVDGESTFTGGRGGEEAVLGSEAGDGDGIDIDAIGAGSAAAIIIQNKNGAGCNECYCVDNIC